MPIFRPNETAGTGPSAGLWNRWRGANDPHNWTTIEEDFASFDIAEGATGGDFQVQQDGTDAVAALQIDQVGGVVRLATVSTDNEEICLISGGNVAGFFTPTVGKEFFFEARVAYGQITAHSSFVGLCEEATGAANMTLDAGTMGDLDYIGFQVLEADVDQIEPVYHTASGTAVVVKADAQTIVADTYYKLGIWGDGSAIHWLINGVEIASADVAHPVTYGTTGVPDGQELAATVSLKAHTTAAKYVDVDFIKASAER